MGLIKRQIQGRVEKAVSQGKSILLLGPRQTGKTTLMNQIPSDLTVSFIQPRVRLKYEVDPSALADEIAVLAEAHHSQPLVIIDEVQKVPSIMDVAQDLIDRKVAQFILTGSSARKLKHGPDINLLPGRVLPLHMDPLSISEIPSELLKLEDLLLYGSLPHVVLTKSKPEKEELLDAYVSTYLEEEIRAEAVVRNLGNFARFLELAASESGYTTNQSKLSQAIGVAHTTIAGYYQILDDCLIAERIEPLTKSKTRSKLSKTQKYIFFDLGLRRLAAREGVRLPLKHKGHLFEQFIMLELIKQSRLHTSRIKIKYWHDPGGPEVDCVIDTTDQLIPIEVKYTDSPSKADAKHLLTFLSEYEEADKAYVVCRVTRKRKLFDTVYAIPWQSVDDLIDQ